MPFRLGTARAAALLLAVLALQGVAPATASAQGGRPLQVFSRRNLAFGDVFPGVPKAVSRLDPTSSAHLEVRGQGGAEVAFTFTLPAALVSGGGQSLSIQFGVDDGGFAQSSVQASSVGFDPRVSYTNRLAANNRAFLWLGGTVMPSSAQAAGVYQGTITLTVAYTGN